LPARDSTITLNLIWRIPTSKLTRLSPVFGLCLNEQQSISGA
jgi:hypothetical protein